MKKPKAESVYTIRPLRWKKHRKWAGWTADIWDEKYIAISEECASGDGKCMLYLPYGGEPIDYSEYKSVESAKAAAERWYIKQLRKALRKVNLSRAKTKKGE